ncbi:MAG: ATP-binding protein [Anaerolineae bacterium]|nr:ATP-binding protein [Anaerolineae bacterium]
MNSPSSARSTLFFRIENVHDVSDARRKGLLLALDVGFATADATKIAVVISELGRNIVSYARSGTITVLTGRDDGTRRYIKIIADDRGPGIKDLRRVLDGGYTTSNGLGLGVSGSQKLMDEFAVRTGENEGTTITAVKWLR